MNNDYNSQQPQQTPPPPPPPPYQQPYQQYQQPYQQPYYPVKPPMDVARIVSKASSIVGIIFIVLAACSVVFHLVDSIIVATQYTTHSFLVFCENFVDGIYHAAIYCFMAIVTFFIGKKIR